MNNISNETETEDHQVETTKCSEDVKRRASDEIDDDHTSINIAKVVKCSEHDALIETDDNKEIDPGKGDDNVSTGKEEECLEDEVLIETDGETRKAPDGGWGWIIVFGCLLLRTVVGGFARSSGLFYVKFTERFGESAAKTAWVTSLSATVRLLVGPFVSILCNRYSCRKLTFFGSGIFVIAVHISAYANSLGYLYFSYGVLGGFGRSFILTPLTILLGEYFDKRRSLAFGLASAGFGIGGFAITPTIELMFQEYGFRGTYILLSGVACHLFVSASLFRPVPTIGGRSEKTRQKANKKSTASVNHDKITEYADNEDFYISSTGSVYMCNLDNIEDVEGRPQELPNGKSKDKVEKEDNKTKQRTKKKLISFSVLKDIRFVTLCIATFIFTLPSSGLFLPALAKSRGVSDIQAAYLLSIIAGSDTVSRVIAGFVLDLRSVRDFRPFIYNFMSFVQCVAMFSFPSLHTFKQFAGVCVLHGFVMGTKAAQRNVVLVDILGVDKLSSSFAILLAVQGIGTLAGPPVSGYLKDTYGKYDYTFYFGGSCILLGAIILACGNIRNHFDKKKKSTKENSQKE